MSRMLEIKNYYYYIIIILKHIEYGSYNYILCFFYELINNIKSLNTTLYTYRN